MATKIYVGNMSYATTQQTLEELFSAHGEVTSVTVVTDRQTGRPRGFAFVEMATEEGADAAIAALNNQMVDGRELKVDKARPRKPRNDDRRGGQDRRRW